MRPNTLLLREGFICGVADLCGCFYGLLFLLVVALSNLIEKHQHQSGNKCAKNDKKVEEIPKDNFLEPPKVSQQKSTDKSAASAAAKKSSTVGCHACTSCNMHT